MADRSSRIAGPGGGRFLLLMVIIVLLLFFAVFHVRKHPGTTHVVPQNQAPSR